MYSLSLIFIDTEGSGEEQRGQSRPDTFRLSISKPSHKTPFKDAIEGAMLKISRKKSLSTKMSPNRSRNKVNRDLGCVYAHSGNFFEITIQNYKETCWIWIQDIMHMYINCRHIITRTNLIWYLNFLTTTTELHPSIL